MVSNNSESLPNTLVTITTVRNSTTYVVVEHVFQQPQLPVTALGMDGTLEGSG